MIKNNKLLKSKKDLTIQVKEVKSRGQRRGSFGNI